MLLFSFLISKVSLCMRKLLNSILEIAKAYDSTSHTIEQKKNTKIQEFHNYRNRNHNATSRNVKNEAETHG